MSSRYARTISVLVCASLTALLCAGLGVGEPPAVGAESLDTWYLAEGTNDWGFVSYFYVLNPNTSPVTVRVTLMRPGQPPTGSDIPVPAEQHVSLEVNREAYTGDFSTKFECLDMKPIAVSRAMVWPSDAGDAAGVHTACAVPAPANKWYLPEGSSAWGFECYLCVQNPNATAAYCQMTYMIEGVGPQVVNHVVPANSRQTYSMVDEIGNHDASIMIESDQSIIPERAMYRNGKREGHESTGTTSLSNDYFLAEGTSSWGFTTYVLVQNPNTQPVDVDITYMTTEGPVPHPRFSMPPNSRKTIRVNDYLPGKDFSTRVHGSLPIIAERSMYWDNGTGEACHDSIGLSAPHMKFYFAYGEVHPDPDYFTETWTMVQNPNGAPVRVRLTYYSNAMDPYPKTVRNETVPANSRSTFEMPNDNGATTTSVVVESLDAGRPIMSEQATYFLNRMEGGDTIGSFSG